MLTIPGVTINAHWLPDDAKEAEASYLEVLHSPGDTFIDAFGLNWEDYAHEIVAADAHGVKMDVNIDHIQSATPTVKPVLALMVAGFKASGTGSVLTIVSAPSGHIWHEKSTVSLATDGGEHFCITGSTNITLVAMAEGNHLLIFRSDIFANQQIAQHKAIATLCRQRNPQWQIMDVPVETPSKSSLA